MKTLWSLSIRCAYDNSYKFADALFNQKEHAIALLVVTSVRKKIPYVYIIEFSEHKVWNAKPF